MAVTIQQEVAALYSAIFNRAPDQAGLEYWVDAIEAGSDLTVAAEGFATHPVFTAEYGSLTNIQFVQKLYQNVLGSEGDAEGIQYWADQLAAGASQGAVVAQFVQTSLNVDLDAALAAGELDQASYDAAVIRQETVTNKANVGLYFTEQFGAASNVTGDDVATDPAYLAAQAAIAGVTNDPKTVEVAQGRIDQALKSDDPAGSLSSANSGLNVLLEDLVAAQKALADFTKEAGVDGGLNVEAAAVDLATAVNKVAPGTVAAKAFNNNDDLSSAEKTILNGLKSLQADLTKEANTAITSAQKGVNEAQAKINEADPKAKAAINTYQTAESAQKAAVTGADKAEAAANLALAQFAADNVGAKVTGYTVGSTNTTNVEVDYGDAAGTKVTLTVKDGVYSAAAADASKPGISDLLNAINADQKAIAVEKGATSDLATANAELKAVSGAESLYKALTGAQEKLQAAQDNATDLNKAYADLNVVENNAAHQVALEDNVTAAEKALDDADVFVNDTTFGTANDDLFIADLAANAGSSSTIAGFGLEGLDKLFVGSDYVLGGEYTAGKSGSANALEVFVNQEGINTVLTIEQKAFAGNDASNPDVVSITLSGVTGDLVIDNGFLQLA